MRPPRPVAANGEATHRALSLAEIVDVPIVIRACLHPRGMMRSAWPSARPEDLPVENLPAISDADRRRFSDQGGTRYWGQVRLFRTTP